MTGIASAAATDAALSVLAVLPVVAAVTVGHYSTRRHRAAMDRDVAAQHAADEKAARLAAARHRGRTIARTHAATARGAR